MRLFTLLRLSSRCFFEVYKFNKGIVLFSLLVLAVNSISTYFNIYLSKVIVDSLFGGSIQMFYYSLLALLSFQLISTYLSSLLSVKSVQLCNAFNNKCDAELIDSLESMDLIIKENPKFNGDFSYLRYIKGRTYEFYLQFTQVCLKVVMLCIGLQFLFDVHIVFSLLAVVFGIVKGLFNLKPVKWRARMNEELQRKTIKYIYLYELLTGIKNQRELMIYRVFDFFKQKWRAEKEDYDQAQIQMEKMNSKLYRQQEGMFIVFNVFIIMLFAFIVKDHYFTVGNYILITMAVGITISNFSAILEDFAQMSENQIHYKNLYESSYYSDTYMKAGHEGIEEFSIHQRMEVTGLSFTYPNSEQAALDRIDLTIEKGETVVILGENGSGKSTLVKVLLGLYQSAEDHVFIDGIPISRFNKKSIFDKTSIVFQDFIQYQTTIRDNVGISDIYEYQNDERMLKVLQHIDFKLQQSGLETKVGIVDEQAINLSGGQWQRLALSRFYFKQNPELAVFDEATSALDPLTEVRLFNDILSYCKDMTTVIISHRVGIARRADKILIMECGRIVEIGNHRELIEAKGIYYDMWMSQKEWYQDKLDEVLAV